MRCYINKVSLDLHDIRDDEFKHLYTDDYVAPQQFAKHLRTNGSNGLLCELPIDATPCRSMGFYSLDLETRLLLFSQFQQQTSIARRSI